MTGATAGSSVSLLADDAEEIGDCEEPFEVHEGNLFENSWKPPRMMYDPPVQPSLLNFLRFSNFWRRSSSLNVSASFCTLKDARLSKVVGIQRLSAPAMRPFAY
ncbi:unnamed protein product [Periconia digitata]|uniref:Uncharacterized protein n=1 Tax=Periconia digitata TaxID=1303443 RepID=A0A9W4XQF9_9PLEO|nr:unnamed protein product [Periconia digitata]